jgi:hypothetical protein
MQLLRVVNMQTGREFQFIKGKIRTIKPMQKIAQLILMLTLRKVSEECIFGL